MLCVVQLEREVVHLKAECEQLKEQTVVSLLLICTAPSHLSPLHSPTLLSPLTLSLSHTPHTPHPFTLPHSSHPSPLHSPTPPSHSSQVASRERKYAIEEKDQAVTKLHKEKRKNSQLKAKVSY